MSIFDSLSSEEIKEDLEGNISVVETEMVSLEEELQEIEVSIKEGNDLSTFIEEGSETAEVLSNASNEEITPVLADALNRNMSSLQRIVTSAGGPDLGLKTYSAEDFNRTMTHRQLIAKDSSESAWEKVK